MAFNLRRYWQMHSTVLVVLPLCCAVVILCLVSMILIPVFLSSTTTKIPAASDTQRSGYHFHSNETFLVASAIYVISLPRRTDRRETFDILGATLKLRWNYFDAVDSNHPIIGRILDIVRTQREAILADSGPMQFYWPEDINAISVSGHPIDLGGSDLWTSDGAHGRSSSSVQPELPSNHSSETPLTCALEDNMVPLYDPELSDHQILNAPKIACWHSHLSVIRLIANAPTHTVTLILEDDVDMEWDIRERLEDISDGLPTGWDIVFLGHCWSDESYYSPLKSTSPRFTPTHSLHPSHSPRCTHAYLLSKNGARRLLLHLRHPPFAYSRAIDQAFAWLVKSGRLRAYSVVPSLVVQRKATESDVREGLGSSWREGLFKGVLEI